MIGQYEIIGKLGAGGMGTVHMGRAPDGRIVAVKVIHPRLADDEQFLERFRREAALARRVAAFCTAPVIDFGEDSQGLYLVTEYVDGIPLSRAVAERGPLPSSSVQGVAVGVAAALTAIHSAGLIHRDLKPGNVILSLCGPRVIDFGVARAVDGSSDLTRTGMMVGSPGWMAPEQARGGPVTQAADIFGWGCLVAFAATGRHPFGEGDSVTRVLQILHEQPDLSGLPDNLYPHVARAVSKRPEDRPTARALLSQLSGGEGDISGLIQLPGLQLAGSAPRKRRRWPVLVALGVGLSAAALAAGVAYPSLLDAPGDAVGPPSPAVSPSATARMPDPAPALPVPAKSISPSAAPVTASAASSPEQARPSPSPAATTPAPTPSPSRPPVTTPPASPAPSGAAATPVGWSGPKPFGSATRGAVSPAGTPRA
ncbi:serine/threonine-protein kinase [Longispora sp. K20-0274]|uniref:serine/threonine-protein kinase n=1 Tax=Longispora sp. K20-0274 TaxID=3088255 RepID=UPI003999E433